MKYINSSLLEILLATVGAALFTTVAFFIAIGGTA